MDLRTPIMGRNPDLCEPCRGISLEKLKQSRGWYKHHKSYGELRECALTLKCGLCVFLYGTFQPNPSKLSTHIELYGHVGFGSDPLSSLRYTWGLEVSVSA